MGDADINTLTMEQYLELTRGNEAPGVIKPKIRGNVNFEIKSLIMRELREDSFSRNKNDDAYEHMERVLDIASLFNISGITHDPVMMRVFPITLTGAAKRWVDRLSPGSINTLELLKIAFIQRYCPPSKIAKQLEEIHSFKQVVDETMYQALERSTSKRVSNDNSNGIAGITNKLDSFGKDIKKLKENVHISKLDVRTIEELTLTKTTHFMKRYRVGPSGYYTRMDNRPPFVGQCKAPTDEASSQGTTELQGVSFVSDDNMQTNMLVEMADMTKRVPVGIVENILVKIDKFVFPSDFVIIDMPGNLSEMAILGRPFLATIHAQIDVFHGEISLGIGENWVIFDINRKAHHSTTHVEKIYMINQIQEEESFNLIEIGEDLFLMNPLHGPGVDLRKKAEILDSGLITSRWHVFTTLNQWWLKGKASEARTLGPKFFKASNFLGIRNDPYSRSLDEYKSMFDKEIEQLANRYELRIGKKGYILDDIWKKCERVHGRTSDSWHDQVNEEVERGKCALVSASQEIDNPTRLVGNKMGDADINTLTMEQYLALTHENQAPSVVKPKIRGNVNLEIKSQFMRVLREDTLLGNKNYDAYEHVEMVLDIVTLFNIPGVTHDPVMLCVFPITLSGAAKRWVDILSPGSINTWELLKNAFIQRYCTPSKTAKQLEEIHKFKQDVDETCYKL
ncbi:RNA-directed DNA polymerase, eukaryota, reverse transcriptase zinc-binding domain protein [Tanacetum coccineum]